MYDLYANWPYFWLAACGLLPPSQSAAMPPSCKLSDLICCLPELMFISQATNNYC